VYRGDYWSPVGDLSFSRVSPLWWDWGVLAPIVGEFHLPFIGKGGKQFLFNFQILGESPPGGGKGIPPGFWRQVLEKRGLRILWRGGGEGSLLKSVGGGGGNPKGVWAPLFFFGGGTENIKPRVGGKKLWGGAYRYKRTFPREVGRTLKRGERRETR